MSKIACIRSVQSTHSQYMARLKMKNFEIWNFNVKKLFKITSADLKIISAINCVFVNINGFIDKIYGMTNFI